MDAERGDERWRMQHDTAVPVVLPLPGREVMLSVNVGEQPRLKFWHPATGEVIWDQEAAPYLTQFHWGWHGRWFVGRAWAESLVLWDATLMVLPGTPLSETVPRDLQVVQTALQGATQPAERAWLGFVEALLCWRRRFEIEIERAPERIQVGEFDIELEG